MDKKLYAELEGYQREVNRKNLALDKILEILKPWPENQHGRFGEIRRIARKAR
jgi:hypothetical protein